MRKSNWEDVGEGIMIWAPTQVTTQPLFPASSNRDRYIANHDAQKESDHEAKHDPNLEVAAMTTHTFPPYSSCIQEQVSQPHFPSRASSPETIAASSGDGCCTPSESNSSTPASNQSDLFFEQSHTFARLTVSEPPETPLCQSTSSPSERSEADSCTDVTHFRTDIETPCPKRQVDSRPRTTGITSRYFKGGDRSARDVQGARLLNMGRLLACRKKMSNIGISRKLEPISRKARDPLARPPRQEWRLCDKILLLVMKRFYVVPEPEWENICTVLQKITGLERRSSPVRQQFHNMKYFGAKASTEWSSVFDEVSFSNPGLVFGYLMKHIESSAKCLDISLERTMEEPDFAPGSAEKAKNPGMKKKVKQKIKVTKQQKKHGMQVDGLMTEVLNDVLLTGCTTLKTTASYDMLESLTDTEGSAEPVIALQLSAEDMTEPPIRDHHLAFRVWVGEETQLIMEHGLLARNYDNALPLKGRAPSPDDPDGEFWHRVLGHFSTESRDGSDYLSVTTALIQLFTKAADKRLRQTADSKDNLNLKVAVISLAAPCLNTRNKLFYAKPVIQQLKGLGGMRQEGRNYKGACEYIIWRSIDPNAIIATINFSDIESLCEGRREVTELLHIEDFCDKISTKDACNVMRGKNIKLNASTAKGMGYLARLFGLHGLSVQEIHIYEFIVTLFEGWCIQLIDDEHEIQLRLYGTCFARSLNSETMIPEQVAHAFIQGVERGLANIERYRPKGRNRNS